MRIFPVGCCGCEVWRSKKWKEKYHCDNSGYSDFTLLVFIYYLFMNFSAFFCAFLFYARFRQEKVYLAIFPLSTIRTLAKECNWLVTFLCILSMFISHKMGSENIVCMCWHLTQHVGLHASTPTFEPTEESITRYMSI